MPAKLTQPAAPEYFGKSAAATYLGVSIDTIDRRIADGTIPAARLGKKKILIRRADLDAALRPISSAKTGVVA